MIAKRVAQKLAEQKQDSSQPVEMTPEMAEQMKRFQEQFAPEELDPELQEHLSSTGGSLDMPMIHHPLLVSVPYSEQMNRIHNTTLREKKKWLAEKEQEKNWNSAIYIHERPYRLQAFLKYQRQMNDQQYWENLGSIWIDSEGPGINKDMWSMLFNSKRPNREYLMDETERKAYEALPPVLTVYRGANAKDKTGMSWSLNKDKATWFANRFNQKGQVWQATVNKQDTYAYFGGRGEDEILLNPKALKNTKRIAG